MKKLIIGVGCVTFLIIPLTVTMYIIDGSLFKIPLYIYSSFYFTVTVGSITIYTWGVYIRLESVSRLLAQTMKRSKTDGVIHVKTSEDDTKVIATLSEIYQDLIEICDDINICYGLTLMLGFGLIYFFSLFTSFTVYTDFLNVGSFTNVSVSSLGFCIYYNIVLASVILTCFLLGSEVRYLCFIVDLHE